MGSVDGVSLGVFIVSGGVCASVFGMFGFEVAVEIAPFFLHPRFRDKRIKRTQLNLPKKTPQDPKLPSQNLVPGFRQYLNEKG